MKFSNQTLALWIALFLFGKISSVYVPAVSAADVSDAVVRRSLEIALGKSLEESITKEDLAQVKHLSFRRHFRIALTLPIGLTNLTTLEIFDNTLTSLALPEDLKNLEFLNIQNNQLPALTLPEGLENLTHLYLRGNSIASLSLPNGLSRLEVLDISRVDSSRGCARRSGMQSLTLPEGMTRLTRLYLYGNSLTALTLPDDLRNLQELDLGGNSLRELNLPSSLTSLQRLNLSENRLSVFILPEGLTNLKVLDLDLNYNYIGHRRQLVSLVMPFGLDVSMLRISGFPKADIARYNPHSLIPDPGLQTAIRQALGKSENSRRITAEDLKSLTELDASQSALSKRPPVRNLQGLEMATNLLSLNLNGNGLASLDLSGGILNLKTLDLSQNALESLVIPEELANLQKLNINGNRLNSLVLPLNMDVVNLQLSGFPKTDIARYNPHSLIPDPGLQTAVRQALGKGGDPWRITAEDLKSLTELNASQSASSRRPPVRNLQGLEMATNLLSLNLNGNGLTSLTLPAGLVNLKTLNLSRNSLWELTLPTDLARLETLYLNYNDFSELVLPADLTRLSTLNLVDNNLISLTLPEGMPQLRRLYLNGNPINQLAVPQGRNIDNLRVYGFSKADIAFYDLETRASKTLAIIPLEEGGLQISWSGGSLQSSADLSGNWEDVEGESPLPIEAAGASSFFRLRP